MIRGGLFAKKYGSGKKRRTGFDYQTINLGAKSPPR